MRIMKSSGARRLALLAGAAFLLLACEEGVPSDPANGRTEVRADTRYLDVNGTLTGKLFTASEPLTNTTGTTRSFYWDFPVNNLCVAAPEGNNRAKWDVIVTAQAPASLSMTGRVYHAAGFNPYTIALVKQASGLEWKATYAGIGLVQGSQDGIRNDIISELVLSFTTTGNIDGDLALAKSFLTNIDFEVDYQYIKP